MSKILPKCLSSVLLIYLVTTPIFYFYDFYYIKVGSDAFIADFTIVIIIFTVLRSLASILAGKRIRRKHSEIYELQTQKFTLFFFISLGMFFLSILLISHNVQDYFYGRIIDKIPLYQEEIEINFLNMIVINLIEDLFNRYLFINLFLCITVATFPLISKREKSTVSN